MTLLRIPLPGGTVKVKTYPMLRTIERERRVPVLHVGRYYLVWWSRKHADQE